MKPTQQIYKPLKKVPLSRSISNGWIFIQAWVLLLLVDLLLRFVSFNNVQKLLIQKNIRPQELSPELAIPQIKYIRRVVLHASRNHLYRLTCLRQSLVMQWMLARRHIPTNLRIGVKKENNKFSAHAWLEYEGKKVGNRRNKLERFTTLYDSEETIHYVTELQDD